MNNITGKDDLKRHGAMTSGTRVISVTSGKGGVGKTNVVVNLAIALARLGKRCLVLDADLGLGNVDILLGLTPQYNIGHVLRGEKTMGEIVVDGPSGIKILPAGSGLYDIVDLQPDARIAMISLLESYCESCGGFDFMLIDTAAGISSNVLFFNIASREIVVVVTHEPTAITDAYALMKVLSQRHGERSFRLIVNEVKSKKEGLDVYRNISAACDKFLSVSVDYTGCVLYDELVHKSVIKQRAVVDAYADSKASASFAELAGSVLEQAPPEGLKGGMQLFWRSVLSRSAM